MTDADAITRRHVARIQELEEALRPFARLCVADDRMGGITPETLRAAVAAARTALVP